MFLKCFLIVSSNSFLSFFAVSTDSSSGSFSDFSDDDFLDFFESRDSRDIFLEFCDLRLDVDFVLVSEFSDSLDFRIDVTISTLPRQDCSRFSVLDVTTVKNYRGTNRY